MALAEDETPEELRVRDCTQNGLRPFGKYIIVGLEVL